jgi:hypothetical protein
MKNHIIREYKDKIQFIINGKRECYDIDDIQSLPNDYDRFIINNKYVFLSKKDNTIVLKHHRYNDKFKVVSYKIEDGRPFSKSYITEEGKNIIKKVFND